MLEASGWLKENMCRGWEHWREQPFDMGCQLVHLRIMLNLNISDAKTHFSRYLDLVIRGETVVLCKRSVPVAEIRPLPPERREPRPVGLAKGELHVAPEFFLPLPEDLKDSRARP